MEPREGAGVNKHKVAIAHDRGCFPASGKGKQFNTENAALYASHQFRIFGAGNPTDISVAQQAFVERPDPCNGGWCQDLIQAAMLNFTDEAAALVAACAAATDHSGFRFDGFAGAYQEAGNLIVTPPERRADVTVLPRMNRDYLNIFFLQKDLDQLLSCLLPRGQTARITA